jgi:hypothetical protein
MLGTLATAAVLATAPGSANHKPPVKFKHHPECATVRCARAGDRAFNRHRERARRRRLARLRRNTRTATASFYDDGGSTACGTHYTYGFAHLGPGEGSYAGMACGTRVLFCAARCVIGTMDDHGPYVEGREYDLNRTLKDAIGASDLGTVRVRVLG